MYTQIYIGTHTYAYITHKHALTQHTHVYTQTQRVREIKKEMLRERGSYINPHTCTCTTHTRITHAHMYWDRKRERLREKLTHAQFDRLGALGRHSGGLGERMEVQRGSSVLLARIRGERVFRRGNERGSSRLMCSCWISHRRPCVVWRQSRTDSWGWQRAGVVPWSGRKKHF